VPSAFRVTDVFGQKKVVPKRPPGALWMIPVSEHDVRPASDDFARLSNRHWLTRRPVSYLDVDSRTRLPTGESPRNLFWDYQTGEKARLTRPVQMYQFDPRQQPATSPIEFNRYRSPAKGKHLEPAKIKLVGTRKLRQSV